VHNYHTQHSTILYHSSKSKSCTSSCYRMRAAWLKSISTPSTTRPGHCLCIASVLNYTTVLRIYDTGSMHMVLFWTLKRLMPLTVSCHSSSVMSQWQCSSVFSFQSCYSPEHLASRHYLSSDSSAFSFGLGLQAF